MKRIGYYGGSFDPVHAGHLAVARALIPMFAFDEFYLLPAYHAPHKPDQPPASVLHRFAMLCIATANDQNIRVSSLEIDSGAIRYTVDTLEQLRKHHPNDALFFVMGADSWAEIITWKNWERVLESVNHIVVSRPGFDIGFTHVTAAVRERVVDLRGAALPDPGKIDFHVGHLDSPMAIFVTDSIDVPVSGTRIREDALDGEIDRRGDVPEEVAKYIEKYELYR